MIPRRFVAEVLMLSLVVVVVHPTPFAIHADFDVASLQFSYPIGSRELASLVRVEYLRFASGLLHRIA